MKEALYYQPKDHNQVECMLCPHHCLINDGQRGICRVRYNDAGKLFSEVYGYPAAISMDPIEKKPLYHFFPGKNVLSIGTVGCNLRCFYCQNCDISQVSFNEAGKIKYVPVDEMVLMANGKSNNIGMAYTYNEPTIFFEYMYDIAIRIKHAGLKNIMVSNGYIEHEALKQLGEVIDAYNIDLKGFTDRFYKKNTSSSIKPVLESIQFIAKSGAHLELTNLLIPELNTSIKEFINMVKWIRDETGSETVLHLSRYFPRYKADIPSTPAEVLKERYYIAQEYLHHVYLGNINEQGFSDTICYRCNANIIKRNGYGITLDNIDSQGNCKSCGTKIISNF
jgi:pyruvate formate lyase activating enzyme